MGCRKEEEEEEEDRFGAGWGVRQDTVKQHQWRSGGTNYRL